MIYDNFIEFIRIPTLLRLLFGSLKDKSQFRHANYQNRRSLKNSSHHNTFAPTSVVIENASGSFLEVGILWKRDITNQRQRRRPQRKTKAQRKHEHGGANPGGVLRHVFFSACHVILLRKLQIYILGPTTTLGKYCDKFWVFWVLSFATAVSCLSRVWTNNIMYISHSQWISSNHLWPNLSTENYAHMFEKYENIYQIYNLHHCLWLQVFSQLTSITLDLDRSTVVQWVGWKTMVDTIKTCTNSVVLFCWFLLHLKKTCFVLSNTNSSSQIIIKSLDRSMSHAVSDLPTLSWWSLSFSMSFARLTQLRSLYIVCESPPRGQNMPKSLLVPVSQRNMT